MPINIPENDITVDVNTDVQEINIKVDGGDAEIFALEAKGYRDQTLSYSNEAKGYRNQAISASSNALIYKNEAGGYATNASQSANNASNSATLSRSWAVGDTASRAGEETDNSKYYAEVSQSGAGTSQHYAEEAEDTLETIRTLVSDTVFTVNFITGELEYESPDITFLVNTTTGNLEWEVVE